MMDQNFFVMGTGTMGLDLAVLLGLNGLSGKLWHRISSELARERLVTRLNSYVKKEILSPRQSEVVLSRITPTNALNEVANCDIVLESVIEDMEVKRDLLARVDVHRSSDSFLATNTSCLSIDELASSLEGKTSFLGLHFFYPALKMPLVELITGTYTDEATVEACKGLCERLGKDSVIVADTPGFIVNRLLLTQMNEAFRMHEQGIATKEAIDCAVQKGLGHPLGPFALADVIGLDVVEAILEQLFEQTGERRFKPQTELQELVDSGLLGRKTNKGFYSYP